MQLEFDDAFSVFDRGDEHVAVLDVEVGQECDVLVVSVDDGFSSWRLSGGRRDYTEQSTAS